MRSSAFVPVVFITDDNYVVPTAVAITSMIKHKRASTNYQIFIISTCLSSANVDCFKQLETDGVKIEVVQTDVSDLEQLHEFEKNNKVIITESFIWFGDLYNEIQKEFITTAVKQDEEQAVQKVLSRNKQ